MMSWDLARKPNLPPTHSTPPENIIYDVDCLLVGLEEHLGSHETILESQERAVLENKELRFADDADEAKFFRAWASYWHGFSKELVKRLAEMEATAKKIQQLEDKLREMRDMYPSKLFGRSPRGICTSIEGSKLEELQTTVNDNMADQQKTIQDLVNRVEHLEGFMKKFYAFASEVTMNDVSREESSPEASTAIAPSETSTMAATPGSSTADSAVSSADPGMFWWLYHDSPDDLSIPRLPTL